MKEHKDLYRKWGRFRFRGRGDNGEPLVSGQGYDDRRDRDRGVVLGAISLIKLARATGINLQLLWDYLEEPQDDPLAKDNPGSAPG